MLRVDVDIAMDEATREMICERQIGTAKKEGIYIARISRE